jgi:peptide/nickel transport system permease protein
MIAYIIRRIAYSLVLVVLVSFVGFIVIELPPGDYLTQKIAELQARGDRSAELRQEEYRARYGLDQPLLTRYTIWITNFVRGDFGESFQYEKDVSQLIGQRLAMTVSLAIATLAFTWMIAIPAGVYSAVKQYSLGDQILTTVSFIGLGTPGFLLALIILFIAVVYLDQDIGGLFSREYEDAAWSFGKIVDLLKHLWIPALIGSVTGTAGLMRIMRGNLLDTLGQPFIESARARGLQESVVIFKHAVRIAINPLITILGSEGIPGIIVGNALVSMVLDLPTIGPMFINALQVQDMYLAGTCLVFFTILLLAGNLISDILLAWVDPRIRYD